MKFSAAEHYLKKKAHEFYSSTIFGVKVTINKYFNRSGSTP